MSSLYYYIKNREKSDYMINTDRSKMLESGFFENQVWGALLKSWKEYIIAKNKDEYDNMERYADIIQECQYDLGLQVSSFHNIEKSALAFYSSRIAKKNNSDNCEHSGNNNSSINNDNTKIRYQKSI
jgi:hypothetical protein